MKKYFILGLITVSSFLIGFFLLYLYIQNQQPLSPLAEKKIIITEKLLDKYAFESMKKRDFAASEITLDKVIKEDNQSQSIVFYYYLDGKRVSGLMNLPKKSGKFPVILQLRGYVPKETYTIGEGTIHSGEVFAKNGFITLAPDFLGYGESASPSAQPLEERFQTYTTALTLLSSISNLNQALTSLKDIGQIEADIEKIGLWGHSNGGQIALSVLEITGKSYPTVLWNPVSKPFPYSILYYTDELDDHGKALRKIIADFEKDYDIEKYSPANYLAWINAPIQLHQAGTDEAVPWKWSEQLYIKLQQSEKEATFYTYPLDDHDFSKGSWNTVVARNITFYKKQFTKNE